MYRIYRKTNKDARRESQFVAGSPGQANFPPFHVVQQAIERGEIARPGTYHVTFTDRIWDKMFTIRVKRNKHHLVLA